MNKVLVIVDMQNDFIDGSLGTKEAEDIVSNVAKKIRAFDGDIYGTLDTHEDDYLETQEGKNLPVSHCIKGEEGWALNAEVVEAILDTKANVHDFSTKGTFGSKVLAETLAEAYPEQDVEIEFVGLCTDICVISNAMVVKAFMPEAKLAVDATCCAGVTPESHERALGAMESCQVEIRR